MRAPRTGPGSSPSRRCGRARGSRTGCTPCGVCPGHLFTRTQRSLIRLWKQKAAFRKFSKGTSNLPKVSENLPGGSFDESSMKVECCKAPVFLNTELSSNFHGSFRNISNFFREYPEDGFQLPGLTVACLKRPRPVPRSGRHNSCHATQGHAHSEKKGNG